MENDPEIVRQLKNEDAADVQSMTSEEWIETLLKQPPIRNETKHKIIDDMIQYIPENE